MPTLKGDNTLLFVEAAFEITGRGLIVVPGPPFNYFGTEGRTHFCSVLIQRPDGSTLVAQAHFYTAFFEPLEAQLYLERGGYECVLDDLTKFDVPVGSHLSVVEES